MSSIHLCNKTHQKRSMKHKSRQVVLMAILSALLVTACQFPVHIESRIKRAREEIASQKTNLKDAQ